MTAVTPVVAVTHRRVLALALPMTLANATTPLLGLVGATAIGRLGEAAPLGAMALGALVFDIVFWTFGSLRMATAGFTAQAIGAGSAREVDLALARALLVAAGVGVALVLLRGPIGAVALGLSGASPAVGASLSAYVAIRILAAPFTLANYALLGSTLGRGRTGVGLALQVAITGSNIALTIGLVVGLGKGVEGAALATVMAEMGGTGLGLAVVSALGSRPWACAVRDVSERRAMATMLAVNGDVMVRTLALMGAFALFAARGARAGDVTLAANAVLQNMFLVGGYVLDGFATAAETLCGQALGAGDETAFRRAVRLSVGWSVGFGVATSALLLLVGGAFVDLVTTSAPVRAAAAPFIAFAALSPLAGAAAFAFDGIYIGSTWTGAMRNLMLAAFAIFALALLALDDLGNAGLWWALLLFLVARGAGQAVLYPGLTRKTFSAASQALRR